MGQVSYQQKNNIMVDECNQSTDGLLYFYGGSSTETGEQVKKEYALRKLFLPKRPLTETLLLKSSLGLITDNYEKALKPKYSGSSDDVISIEDSIAERLSSISDKYEQLLYSFPGVVVDIENNGSGEPAYATISVSIDGNDYTIKRYIRHIGFEVQPQMRLIVDCIERAGQKKLSFRLAQPAELDDEELELLKKI